MDRRTASLALVLAPLAASLPARAQSGRPARVAWLPVERANAASPFLAAFRRGMREAGWTEGRDLRIDEWWSDGTGERIDRVIAEAVATKPDLIVAAGGLVVRPLMNAGVTLPVVFVYSGDAVLGGIVASYARPGGTRTGVSLFALDLLPKRIELMVELLPSMKRLAIVGWPRHAGEPREREAASTAAERRGLRHDFWGVSSAVELEAAFDGIARARCDAILAFADGITVGFADRFAAFSRKHRIPAVSGWAVFTEKGNLMSYGPVLQDSYARLAYFADRILKGAKPGDLPVELPSTQELAINRRAAKELGIAIPPALLARADRVVD